MNHEVPVTDHQPLDLSEVRCVGCGCTDSNPCVDLAGKPCAWIAVEADTIAAGLLPGGQLSGICSNCAMKPLDVLLERGLLS